MAFPEGRSDWIKIIAMFIALLRLISEIFFGENPDSDHDK